MSENPIPDKRHPHNGQKQVPDIAAQNIDDLDEPEGLDEQASDSAVGTLNQHQQAVFKTTIFTKRFRGLKQRDVH